MKLKQMGKPPFYDSSPPVMGRTSKKGMGGTAFTIPNGAEFGLGLGKAPTTMSRSGGRSKKGNTFAIPASGPARSSTKDTGVNTSMGKGYGVNGVSGKDVGNKIVNHGGTFGGGSGTFGDTGRYGGS